MNFQTFGEGEAVTKSRKMLVLASALVLGILPTGAAQLVTKPESQPQSMAPLGRGVQVLGTANNLTIVHFQVALRLRNADALTAGNQRHERLTFTQLSGRHLPTRENYNAVLNWLQSGGLTIEKRWKNRLTVNVSGRVATVSRVLHVHFQRIGFEGQTFTSADTAPAIPAALSTVVLSINGLQPHLRAHPMHIIHPLSATSPPLFPAAFLSAYSATGLGNGGKGSTTAIVIDTFPKTSDLTSFWSATGTPAKLGNISFIQTVAGKLPAPSGEESLDVETASGMAPHSKIRVYASRSLSFSNLDTAFQALIDDMQNNVPVDQVSISLGLCETFMSPGQVTTDENLFAVMVSLGASVFVSSGDSGSDECQDGSTVPSYFSTSPNVTSVGGTNLKLRADGSFKSEIGWTGSGGGTSTLFKKPSYQSALTGKKRRVPDVSADADPQTGALVVLNGAQVQIGGTSLAAPIWGGLSALINSSRRAAALPSMGLLNTRVYPLLGTPKFRDIVAGTNGAFTAVAGYDQVTGIGAPVMSKLHPFIVAQP